MILSFAAGAVIGAATTHLIGTRAARLRAALVAATLVPLWLKEPESRLHNPA
jgi:uncharacterized membrane protein YoaK (UPF0700 family)